MQERIYKKYVYISDKIQAEIEEIAKENRITITNRFINQYNFEKMLQTELRNINGINYLLIDLKSIVDVTSEEQIINCLKLIRKMYDVRIIIIAEGYKQGSVLLGKIFNLGIYNIVTANNNILFKEEISLCFSDVGMTFGTAMKYQIDDSLIVINQNNKMIKETYIKVKQTVNIAVASTERHLGATTVALNLTRYLAELPNINPCYIENNNNNNIHFITEDNNANYYEKSGKIVYKGLDIFLKPKNMSDILENDYSFYIYDYGSIQDLQDEELSSFLTKDLKIIVSGNKLWEMPYLVDAFVKIGQDANTYLMFNFVKDTEKEIFRNSVGDFWKEKLYFSDYTPDPFEVQNRYFYENILKPYLLNTNMEEKKKRKFFNFKGRK